MPNVHFQSFLVAASFLSKTARRQRARAALLCVLIICLGSRAGLGQCPSLPSGNYTGSRVISLSNCPGVSEGYVYYYDTDGAPVLSGPGDPSGEAIPAGYNANPYEIWVAHVTVNVDTGHFRIAIYTSLLRKLYVSYSYTDI